MNQPNVIILVHILKDRKGRGEIPDVKAQQQHHSRHPHSLKNLEKIKQSRTRQSLRGKGKAKGK